MRADSAFVAGALWEALSADTFELSMRSLALAASVWTQILVGVWVRVL
jgi:hypothetical protein